MRPLVQHNDHLLRIFRWLLAFSAGLLFIAGCSSESSPPEQESVQQEAVPATSETPDASTAEPSPLPPSSANDDRSVAQRVADVSLAAQVKKALLRSDTLRMYDFEVEARGGHIALRGSVATAQDHAIATELARGVEGVRVVSNEIAAPDVAPEPTLAETDTLSVPAQTLAEADTATPPQETTAKPEPETPKTEAPQEEIHTVRSGESLWRIAQRYDVSVDQLLKLNKLNKSAKIKPGQELRVK